VSLAFDFAMDQVSKGVPFDKVLVPFVLTFGDSVQFGVVYVLDSNFPCAALLTHPLSLLSWSTRSTVCRWIRALGMLCERQGQVLAHVGRVKVPNEKGLLKSSGVFLKPISVHKFECAGFAVAHLMSVFELLRQNTLCRECVVFPMGKMALPSKSQEDIFKTVWRQMDERFHGLVLKQLAGWPIIIYPRLSTAWVNAAHCVDLHLHKECVMERLTEILAAVEEAGVIHLDVRLHNVMVKMPSTGVQEGATSSNSSGSGSSDKPELKIIDWDCCARVGHRVDPVVVLAYTNDFQHRYPRDEPIATCVYHKFFLEKIRKTLEAAAVEASERPPKAPRIEGSV